MFTGIIEEVGEIVASDVNGEFRTLRVRAGKILEDAATGASISVNGVCLTVRSLQPPEFTAELSGETLQRTSLNELRAGAIVNLERPMRADGRFGGHIVQGHVDGVGKIKAFNRDGDNWNLQVEVPSQALRYIVEKGSITIDGISLTVAALRPPVLEIAIIPHTFDNTNLQRIKAGDTVNLELDVIAKYVERLLHREPL